MADITKYISNYLLENPSVVVPGLGRFIAIDKPAQIYGDNVIPPVRTIEFNSSDDYDDQVLNSYVAREENISQEEAKVMLSDFYRQIRDKLAGRKAIMLSGLGTLSVNNLGDFVFDPDPGFQMVRKDSYGLNEVSLHMGELPHTGEEKIVSPDAMPPVMPKSTMEGQAQQVPDPDESIFASDNLRVRENTTRRPVKQPEQPERKSPPVKPVKNVKQQGKAPQKKAPKEKSGGFPVWILLVLLIAGALGVGSYMFYPQLEPYVTSAINAITGNKGTSDPDPGDQRSTDIETDVNPEVAQNLEESTNKKNALNPEGNSDQQTPAEKPAGQDKPVQTQPQTQQPAQTQQPVQTQQPAPVQTAGSGIGTGRYLVIVASFDTHSKAESFGRNLKGEGIGYEIIDFGNGRVRIAIAASDNKAEAQNMANQMKTRPYCDGAWVTPRNR